MVENTFSHYVLMKHAYQYEGFDDDMPDDYDRWLCELDPDELIGWAEEWGKTLQKPSNDPVGESTQAPERCGCPDVVSCVQVGANAFKCKNCGTGYAMEADGSDDFVWVELVG